MKQPLLKGEKLQKTFKQGKKEIPVINNIDIEIYQGDFTVIMGSSGAGKSTLLYLLSGMEAVSSGNIFYKNNNINQCSEKEISMLRAEEFGFVFQQTHLVSNLTLFENVIIKGYLKQNKSAKEINQAAEKLLTKMNIREERHRLPSQVSGGEAQRAAIARAVINNPGIIFADEPTGALNRNNTNEILDLFDDLNKQGQSILMVTHDLLCALRGNRIIYLEDGQIQNDLNLGAYKKEDAKDREIKLSNWLRNLAW